MVNRSNNKGAARWRVTGSPAVGNSLQAALSFADPEGNGPFTYRWQSSSNSITWATVGSNSPNYRITWRDKGKRLRLLTTYTDRKGHFETVTTAAGWVPAPPPLINLSLSSATAIAEDGSGALLYTFKRTGPTTAPLTVKYTVKGTATLGIDYRGIPTTPATKSITFAPGSSTATLTVDPTTDSSIEPNETVELTLAAGAGYVIGTPAAAIGTITNDDVPPPPVISLAVSPASVPEDGPANLAFTFLRSGSTSSALAVNYTVGGSATLGTDYTGINAAGSTKTITFAAGSAAATVSVDPTNDSSVEPDETIALSLAAGTGYTIGTSSPVVGTIANDDVVIPPPPPPGQWSYNWANASPLGNFPSILKASVAMPSPRPGEQPLALTALRVDLRDPSIQLTSTGRRSDWANNTIETTTETSRQYISRVRSNGLPIVAALNSAPFDLNPPNQFRSVPTNIRGFAVSDRQLVSSTDYNGDTFKSTFLYDPVTGARMENKASTLPAPANVTYPAPAAEVALASTLKVATSGFGIVLNNGVVSGDQVLQNARSALGLTADGRFLTMLAVDRIANAAQPSGWQGATDYDVGTILKGFGSSMGMTLDGGGSTQMAWWNSTTSQAELLSNPLAERFVGASLGVMVKPL
jgi:hypothetical protein